MIGGSMQGRNWIAGNPFIHSVTDMLPYWLWRAVGGTLMFLSHLVFAWNVWAMRPRAGCVRARGARHDIRLREEPLAALRRVVLRLHRAGLPRRHRSGHLGPEPYAAAARGGAADRARSKTGSRSTSRKGVSPAIRSRCGRSRWTRSGDGPRPLATTRSCGRRACGSRTRRPCSAANAPGPDLSNVGARQASEVWQYLHLYNPRSVVEGSVMPAFPWLFEVKAEAADGEPVVPLPTAYAPGRRRRRAERARAGARGLPAGPAPGADRGLRRRTLTLASRPFTCGAQTGGAIGRTVGS